MPTPVGRLEGIADLEGGEAIRLVLRGLLLGEERLLRQLLRPFERGQRPEVPDAVQVRRPPRGCAGRPPRHPGPVPPRAQAPETGRQQARTTTRELDWPRGPPFLRPRRRPGLPSTRSLRCRTDLQSQTMLHWRRSDPIPPGRRRPSPKRPGTGLPARSPVDEHDHADHHEQVVHPEPRRRTENLPPPFTHATPPTSRHPRGRRPRMPAGDPKAARYLSVEDVLHDRTAAGPAPR